jgi:hypothetical protein
MDCGDPAETYDHRDYTQPLLVDPVCLACNKRRGPGFPYPDSPPAVAGFLPEGGTIRSLAREWKVSDSTVVRWLNPDLANDRQRIRRQRRVARRKAGAV